ncbi:MAG: PaaX family transcriptional regulator [Euzebyales bacterium]|jgi:phenylacetic acid degradation operon negative regulatory protein|nr:PaaX family transcriptional regulator [Euzebyales bacterium]
MPVPRSKSLILDIYGGFVRHLGGWIAIAHLIRLMGDLGVDEQAVRSSVSRMSRNGMLVRRERGSQVGYEVSDAAATILDEGDLRIFAGGMPARLEDGWVVATFSVPEADRDQRHQLRSRLAWLGFGNLGAGVWLAPRRALSRIREAVEELGLSAYVDLFEAHYRGFDEVARLAERCWDLEGLNQRYAQFIQGALPVVGRWRDQTSGDDRAAFVDYTTILHHWRKLPYLDPGLPQELLPARWQGGTAAGLFSEVLERLEKPARRYVEGVVTRR